MEEVIPASGPTQWGCPFSRKEEREEEGRHGVGRTTGTGPESLDLGSSISSVTGCAEKALNALAAVTATRLIFRGRCGKGSNIVQCFQITT